MRHRVGSLTQADVDARLAQHHAWWDAFYAKSFVEIPNKVVEKEYYASLYLLASASRTGERPPGLWPNWVMKHGGSCVLQSPWPSGSVRVYRNGVDAGTLSGATLTLPTAVNEVIHLAPDGASYQSIVDKMSVPLAGAN